LRSDAFARRELGSPGPDFDAPGPGFLTLRQVNREDAVLELCRRLVQLHVLRQDERATERAVAALVTVGRGAFRAALTADGEQIALELDLDVLGLHPRQVGLDDVLVVATPNLHCRAGIHAFEAQEGRREPSVEAHQIVERIPQPEHGSSLLSQPVTSGLGGSADILGEGCTWRTLPNASYPT